MKMGINNCLSKKKECKINTSLEHNSREVVFTGCQNLHSKLKL